VCQLCVPTTRREPILKLAHGSVYGSHLGERKTCQRIKLSFSWPSLKKSVREYVMSCHDCQLRSRKLTTDRVPITPITKDQIPFQTLNMDCIGPLEPPSAQGHKYCLCIVDSVHLCTCWKVWLLICVWCTAWSVCEYWRSQSDCQLLRDQFHQSVNPRNVA